MNIIRHLLLMAVLKIVTNLIYLIAKGDKIFMLTSFSSTEKYPKYKDNFLGMIKSFEAM